MSGSRYDGFPQVFLSGDKTKALEHLGRAKSLLSEVQKVRGHMQVGVFQKTIRENEVVITARSYGDTHQLFVHAGGEEVVKRREVVYAFPPVLSGYVQARGYTWDQIDAEYLEQKREEKIQRVTQEFAERGETPTEEDLQLTPEEEEIYSKPTGFFSWDQKTLEAYPELLETTVQALHKASTLTANAWGVNASLSGLVSLTDSRDYKSYRWVSGALYTGALSKCAQMVLGLHRTAAGALTELPPFISNDEQAMAAYLMQKDVLPPSRDYVEDVDKHKGFCPQYKCEWASTDGLYKGGKHWWLVRIVRDKIYARKLPVFLGSDKSAFAEHYRTLKLEKVAEAIEYFNGLPTGEGFPRDSAEFAKGLTDGWILDITPNNMPFAAEGWGGMYNYSAWSFSPEGDQAHNVGLRLSGDSYYTKWASIHFSTTTTYAGEEIRARVVPQRESEIYAPPQGVTRVQRIPFKVPTALMDGTVMSVFLATDDADGPKPSRSAKVYDAVVWAGFVGEELQTVSYYYNPKEAKEEVEEWGEAPEDITPTTPGAWEWGEKRGAKGQPMMMYSSVWDTREVLYEQETTYKQVQKKLYEFMYWSVNETGNALAYEWPIFTPKGWFYYDREEMVKSFSEDYRTAVVAYQDRSVYSGAAKYELNSFVSIEHENREFEARGPWRMQAFRCEFWIWFTWRLDCAKYPKETVVRKIDPESGRELYISSCNQKCEWLAGVQDQPDRRLMVICVEDNPNGVPEVVWPAPAKCTEVSEWQATGEWVNRSTDTSKSRGRKEESKQEALETQGWYVCPAKTNGYTFHEFEPLEFSTQMGKISPDVDTGEFHSAWSARNCYGYQYEAFAKHLNQGPGYAKIGRLHAGDTEVGRFNIVFVGVLDGE